MCFMLQVPCQKSTCENGGTCTGYGSDYYCDCPDGILGLRCQCTYVMETLFESNLSCNLYQCVCTLSVYISMIHLAPY